MKRFEDYKQEVILAYIKKKNEDTLPPNLQHHTPANIKSEILDVFSKRHSEKDDVTFAFFFGKKTTPAEHFKMIEEAKPSVFKPLNNYLIKDTVGGTHERNIYLLAWLIDFIPRPYRSGDIYELVKNERDSSANIKQQTGGTYEDSKEESKNERIREIEDAVEAIESETYDQAAPETYTILTDELAVVNADLGVPRKFNRTVVAFFAALVIFSGTYIFYDKTKHQCMYWDLDHYTAIPCDQKADGSYIIALDTFSLNNIRKITNLKLITPNSIGKVHYSKVDGKVEFYTAGGENPNDSRKRLLPMTEYIYKKYVLKSLK